MRGNHRSPLNSPHKGQWRGALMFSLICTWINGWVNNREAGDLLLYRAHYIVTVMSKWYKIASPDLLHHDFYTRLFFTPLASCQIRKLAGCACARNVGNVSPPSRVSDPDMHHGTCFTHVPWCIPVSLTSGFLWSLWRGKLFPYSRRMCNLQFCVSGKRSIYHLRIWRK